MEKKLKPVSALEPVEYRFYPHRYLGALQGRGNRGAEGERREGREREGAGGKRHTHTHSHTRTLLRTLPAVLNKGQASPLSEPSPGLSFSGWAGGGF